MLLKSISGLRHLTSHRFCQCISVLKSGNIMTSSAIDGEKIDNICQSDLKKQPITSSELKSGTDEAEPPAKVSRRGATSSLESNSVKDETKLLGQKRRKFAILLAYCGAGYFGMQRQPGNVTIEERVLEALLNAKLIGGDILANPGLAANFQRAARTDKGVSAACQLISIRMSEAIGNETTPSQPETIVEAINKFLPEQIQILGVWRVTRGFDAKAFCGGRTYCYMLPTYALQECTALVQPNMSYRVEQSKLDAINSFLQNYKGTHSFHNFTSGLSAEDRSAVRFMMSLECGKPFVVTSDDGSETLEFVTISIKGQSFMLHQIRKMIALMICVIRGTCSMETLGKCWGPDRVDIPMAPALGLYLNRLHFDVYNKRYGSDGMHAPLDWSTVEDKLEAFKERYIIGHIVRTEHAEKAMLSWLGTLNRHSFDYNRLQPEEVTGDKEPPPETNEGVAAKLITESNNDQS